MPKLRAQIAEEVNQAFLAAEQAAEVSAAAIARCVATVIEARGRAQLPPIAGADVIALLAESSRNALDARRAIIAAHPLLEQIGRDLGVISYGPDEKAVPNQPFVGATSPLRVVATAA
jgi:hypothetical protein